MRFSLSALRQKHRRCDALVGAYGRLDEAGKGGGLICVELVSVSFENFKSFKDRVDLDLKRINYLIGANGAGKSNVFAGMLLISNTFRGNGELKPGDYFDRITDRFAKFSFKAELSKDERQELVKRMRDYQDSRVDFSTNRIFQFLKCDMEFKPDQTNLRIQMSDDSGTLRVVQESSSANRAAELRVFDISNASLESMHNPNLSERTVHGMRNIDLINIFDASVSNAIMSMFNLRLITEHRRFGKSMTSQEDNNVLSDGRNLPSRLGTMRNKRSKMEEFEKTVKGLSSGEIIQVNTSLTGQNVSIELQELGRANPTLHDEISIGQHQQLILPDIIKECEEKIIMVEEPELHLHAGAQKKLLALVREIKDKQLIIATHSPIFVNSSDAESTFLVAKYNGKSEIVPIRESDLGQIRTCMGLTQADVLGSEYLCCVEGKSENIIMPALARKLGYNTSLAPWTLDIKGQGNTKYLGPLVRHLAMSGMGFFVLLDENRDAHKHVNRLLKDGTISEGQYHFLDRNVEDLFSSDMLLKHTRRLAKEKGVTIDLSLEDLDEGRKDASVIDVLEKGWQKRFGEPYPKTDLATCLACDSADVPPEAKKIILKIMDAVGATPAKLL